MHSQAGKICLRYIGGTAGNEMCESYACGDGYKCDCTGSETCSISACVSGGSTYHPTSTTPTSTGVQVPCRAVSATTCMTVQAGGSGSGAPPSQSPTASTASSPGAMPSVSPTTSAIATPSTPSISVTPTMTPTMTPTPSMSMSPSPAVIAGLVCDAANPDDSTCGGVGADHACDCSGHCAERVAMQFEFIGDDHVIPNFCGGSFTDQTPDLVVPGSWSYSGPCVSNVIIKVLNTKGYMALIGNFTTTAQGSGPGTLVVTDSALTGMVSRNPSDLSFLTDPQFDFANSPQWKSIVQSTNTPSTGYDDYMLAAGPDAVMWTYNNGPQDSGDYYFMMPNPNCPTYF